MTNPDANPVSDALPAPVLEALSSVAGVPTLLVALDFDGTLSPHVEDPMTARMLPAARDAVHALAALPNTVVALVSGRSLVDLRIIAEHTDDSPITLAASHGAEYWFPGEGPVEPAEDDAERGLRDLLRARAEEIASDYEGVWIEPKTFGFGVHTRNATEEAGEKAAAAVDEMVASAAPTGVAGPARRSSSTPSGTRGKTAPSRTSASGFTPTPCCSPVTTRPTRMPCAACSRRISASTWATARRRLE